MAHYNTLDRFCRLNLISSQTLFIIYAMNASPHLIIVDDDKEICTLLKDFLSKHGFTIFLAHNGVELKKTMKSVRPDLIVLDIMMPGEDGLELCKTIRKASEVPIIMLSAMDEDTDRIIGLEVGADDYLGKPFNPRELLARIKALLRRSKHAKTHDTNNNVYRIVKYKFNSWLLDTNTRQLITRQGLATPLSTGEYDLLLAFVEHAHRTLTRDQLLDITRGREGGPFDRTIDVLVGRLRKKIELDIKSPELIITVRGGGYQFTPHVNKVTE